MARLPRTVTVGSVSCGGQRVAPIVTVRPRRVRIRTTDVSSVWMSLAWNRSGSTDSTSWASSEPSTCSAVTTAWANGLVSAPSITGTPSSSR
ncbi:MAG TPA: hypothetical protein VIC62_04335 [Nakamurella sp.]